MNGASFLMTACRRPRSLPPPVRPTTMELFQTVLVATLAVLAAWLLGAIVRFYRWFKVIEKIPGVPYKFPSGCVSPSSPCLACAQGGRS
jgi:hypothetical protein